MANNQLHTQLTISAGVEGINDINRLADAIEQAGGDVSSLRQESSQLQSTWNALSTDEQTRQLNALSSQAERLRQITSARMTLGLTGDDEVRQQIANVTNAYNQLRQSGTLSQQELARATQLHTQQVAELEARLGQARPTMQDIASEMGNIVASAGGLAYVVKEAMKFETAMADVKKVVDGTPEQIEALSTDIQKMAVEMGMSSEAMAQITAQGGQLGVALKDLPQFTKMAGQMAVAFNMTAEEAGDAAAKMANVWGIPIDKIGGLGDAINTLGNTTAAKEREIVDVMNRIGGTAKSFGLAKEEAAALSAAFISLGKTPEVAGTAINALLTKLSTANVQSDDFKNALAHIGISADQLAKDINNNPQKALDNFLQTLGTLSKEQQSITTFKLFGQEYVDDINILVGGLDTYKKALNEVANKSQTAGAMQKEFEARLSTTGANLEQAKASVGVLAQTIGTHLLPIIATTLQVFTDITGAVTDFANTYPHLTQFITIVASAQVGLTAMSSTMRLLGTTGLLSFGQIATGATTATGAITGATTATAGLNTALSAVAKSAIALTGSFMAGKAVGDWAYENSSAVRTVGDELGRVLAYGDAIFTSRTFADVNEHFKTSADSAKELASQTQNAKTATDALTQSATTNVQAQTQAHIELANNIKITTAELESMELALARMEASGQTGSDAHKRLSGEIANTKDKLELLNIEANKQGIGELLETDLDKASESFKALGLDAQEFATGISSDATQALNAFVEVARLAGNDTDKLARAYNAVKDKIGESTEAQEMLNFKLAQATNGNQALASAVQATAAAQQNAKNATDEQKKALDALGVSIDAANAKMSTSGHKMAQNLKVGLTAIKEQVKGADELKASVATALDTSLASAKTVADFKAIEQAIKDAGLSSQVSSEHMKKIQIGMTDGAEGVKALNDKLKEQTKTLTDHDSALTKTATAAKNFAKAQHDGSKSSSDMAKANQQATTVVSQSANGFASGIAKIVGGIRSQMAAMTSMGATGEQLNQVFDKFGKIASSRYKGIMQLGAYFKELDNLTKSAVKSMADMDAAVAGANQSLSAQTVTMTDLTKAQHTLQNATNFNIMGIVKLDKSKLQGLQAQIVKAEQQMQDFSDTAKQTMQDLDSELATLQGREMDALRIKQAQKLADLQAKMAEATARGNGEEIAHYSKAISLQKQINAEQTRQGVQKALQERQPIVSAETKSIQSISAADVVSGFNARIEQAKQEAKEEGRQEFAKELLDNVKRRAR